MKRSPKNRPQRILAIDPASRGVGFSILESHPIRLVDWGVLLCREKRYAGSTAKIAELVQDYAPTAIVIEDFKDKESQRSRGAKHLLQSIRMMAAKLEVSVVLVSNEKLRETFSNHGAATKEERAAVIAERFPELRPRLPRHREAWMSEDYRMSIFDAVAIGLSALR